MQSQRKKRNKNDEDDDEQYNNNNDYNRKNVDAMFNHEFYNDDIYNYKEYFNRDSANRGNEDDEEEYDENGDTIGPLAINNIGNRSGRKANDNLPPSADNDIDLTNEFYDENVEFHELDDNDDMIMDTFFKKVDSMELVKPKKAKIVANYLFGELLGDGSYGKVKECLDIRNLSRRAVKIINLKTIARKIPKGIHNVRKEISIMKRLNHKNIIKLYDVFEKNFENANEQKDNKQQQQSKSNGYNKTAINPVTGIPISASTGKEDVFATNMIIEKPPKLYIFMDYCMTSLEKLIKSAPNERLCNWQANFYFKQLIDGLEYLHSIGIIHNDIKPGNLLITCDDTLKICDFSISAELNLFFDYDFVDDYDEANNSIDDEDDEERIDNHYNDFLNNRNSACYNRHSRKFPIVQCTPMFQCPEMLAENLNERLIVYNAAKIDIWSTGVSLYQITIGKLPFSGQTIHQIYENIRSNFYEIKMPEFLDKNLEKLLRGMLNRNPLERWSLQEIRDCEWFKKKHPFLKEELAQWPVDVFQNETNTFRMLQYLEKLHQNDSSQPQQQQQQQFQPQNSAKISSNFNNNNKFHQNINNSNNNININNHKEAIKTKHSNDHDEEYDNNNVDNISNSRQNTHKINNDAINSKTYTQATKIKRTTCVIN